MRLTSAGAALFERVVPALAELRAATRDIRTHAEKAVVRVTTIPSLAAYWLVPRVARFQTLFATPVAIDTSVALKTLSPQTFDLAIRHGRGQWAGCEAEKLFDEELIAVCSPSYRGGDLPRDPAQLGDHALVTYQGSREWQEWSAGLGLEHLRFAPSTLVNDAALMIGAAVAGHGIAIGRSAIVLEHLRCGELVALFGARARAEFSYYLVTAAAMPDSPHVANFIAWLRDEADETRRNLDALHIAR